MKILLHNSDEHHTLSSNDIVRYLKGYGVHAECKSIYTDIAILTKFRTDSETFPIISFYVNLREFQLPELKLLVDAVQLSRFITLKDS